MFARRNSGDSVAFLEAAVDHLREAGYTVELDIDDDTGEMGLYVDGLFVRFMKGRTAIPAPVAKPQRPSAPARSIVGGRDHAPRRHGSAPGRLPEAPLGK